MIKEYFDQFKDKEDSALLLLIANLMTLTFAIIFEWSPLKIVWIYLIQALVILFFTVLRMNLSKNVFEEDLSLKTKAKQNSHSKLREYYEEIRDKLNVGKLWRPVSKTKKIIISLIMFIIFASMLGVLLFLVTILATPADFSNNDAIKIVFNAGKALFASEIRTGSTFIFNVIFTALVIVSFFLSHLKFYRKKIKEDEQRNLVFDMFFEISFGRIFPIALITLSLIFYGIYTKNSPNSLFLLIIFMIVKTVIDITSHKDEKRILTKNYEIEREKDIEKSLKRLGELK